MAHKLHSRYTLLIFVAVTSTVTPVCSQEPGSCLQDCSWTSYSNGKEVTNGCEMLISQEEVSKWTQCPNYYDSYQNDFPPKVEIVDVSYYDYPAKGSTSLSGYSSITDDGVTLMCANISFQVAQSGAEHVKAIRLTLVPQTYTDINKVYCQVWNLTTPLTGCSFSAGHCDANKMYTFYYDCFCELGVSGGTYLISVDTLPKKTGQNHQYTTFIAPTCEDHPSNKYCQETPNEHWRPLHTSTKQWCNDTSVNVTFDLAPWEYSVKAYWVFLFQSDQNCTNPYVKIKEASIKAGEVEIFENEFLNQTFNMTTVTFQDLEYGETYVAAFKIAEADKGGPYYLKFVCSSIFTIKYPPCSTNPCSANETCIPDCLNHTCECNEGSVRIDDTCQVSSDQPKLDPLYIGIISASGALMMILTIVTAVCLKKGISHTSCGEAASRKKEDPLVASDVELPESPKGSHSVPNGIRVVCSLNKHLQNFADKLRQVLQDHVGCPVSVHTVWHNTQVGSSSWIAEAKKKEEKVFFIWDKNLSILDYGEPQSAGVQGHAVHHVIDTLHTSEFESIVLLQLDIADSAPLPIELRHCCTYSLPGGLMQLAKDFSSEAEIPSDSFSEVISAYEDIKTKLRQKVCQSSKQSWIDRAAKNDEREQADDDDIGSDESDVSDQEVLIEEEEAGQELLSSLALSC